MRYPAPSCAIGSAQRGSDVAGRDYAALVAQRRRPHETNGVAQTDPPKEEASHALSATVRVKDSLEVLVRTDLVDSDHLHAELLPTPHMRHWS